MSEVLEIRKRAHEFMQRGDLESALEEYRKLLRGDAIDPNIYNLMGDVHFKKGEKEEAFRQYNQAVSAYRKDNLYSNAIAVCRKMARLDPDYIEASRLMGELYLDQGLTGESAGYLLEYAEKLIARAELAPAAETLRKVIESTPGAVKVREQLAEVYANLGLRDEAGSELAAAGDIYEQKGDGEKAEALRAKAEAMRGGSAGAVDDASVEGEGTDRVEIVHKRIGLAHHVPLKIDEVLRSFREEVQRAIGEEDYRSRYDLGMA
ncbi:MAG: tetratricopeptide repeat protein, partial [bacterium]